MIPAARRLVALTLLAVTIAAAAGHDAGRPW